MAAVSEEWHCAVVCRRLFGRRQWRRQGHPILVQAATLVVGEFDFPAGRSLGPSPTRHRWLPSLAIDKRGDIAMGFSTSAGTAGAFPSAVITGRLAGDPLNTLRKTPQSKRVRVADFRQSLGRLRATTVAPPTTARFGLPPNISRPAGPGGPHRRLQVPGLLLTDRNWHTRWAGRCQSAALPAS